MSNLFYFLGIFWSTTLLFLLGGVLVPQPVVYFPSM